MTAAVQNAYNYAVTFPQRVKSMLSCSFLRGDMVILGNSSCYAFVFAFNDFALVLAFIGPFFFVLSCSQFCFVRCPYHKDEIDKDFSALSQTQKEQNSQNEDNTQGN